MLHMQYIYRMCKQKIQKQLILTCCQWVHAIQQYNTLRDIQTKITVDITYYILGVPSDTHATTHLHRRLLNGLSPYSIRKIYTPMAYKYKQHK